MVTSWDVSDKSVWDVTDVWNSYQSKFSIVSKNNIKIPAANQFQQLDSPVGLVTS